jgi:hypothetical protein
VLLQNQSAKFKHYKDIEEPEQRRRDRPELLIQTGLHVEHKEADIVGDQGNQIQEEEPVWAI